MSREMKNGIVLMLLGIALVAVPFYLRMQENHQTDMYIKAFEEVADEEEAETGNKKKDALLLQENVIGIIEIPSIDIKYPIFEGTGNEALNAGIGHMERTGSLDTFAEHLERGTKKTFVGGKKAHDLDFKVSVTPFEKEDSNIRGLARIFIEDSFVIGNVSLLEGKNGLFVAMPSYKTKQTDENGKSVYQDVCYPITKEFREKLFGELIGTYELEKEQKQEKVKGSISTENKEKIPELESPLR